MQAISLAMSLDLLHNSHSLVQDRVDQEHLQISSLLKPRRGEEVALLLSTTLSRREIREELQKEKETVYELMLSIQRYTMGKQFSMSSKLTLVST